MIRSGRRGRGGGGSGETESGTHLGISKMLRSELAQDRLHLPKHTS